MKEILEKIRLQSVKELESVQSQKELEDLRIKYLGKKGELTQVLRGMGGLSPEERPVIGQLANEIRDYINEIDKKTNTSRSAEESIASIQQSVGTEGGAPDDRPRFMVQIANSASKRPLTPSNFNGLQDVFEIESDNQFKYAAGSFDSYSQAAEYRKKIESLYPDAFIIAVRNNKILPLQDAINPK